MKEFLAKKMGPLPVWAWAGVITVAILLGRHVNLAPKAAAAAPVDGPIDVNDQGGALQQTVRILISAPDVGPAPSPGPIEPPAPTPTPHPPHRVIVDPHQIIGPPTPVPDPGPKPPPPAPTPQPPKPIPPAPAPNPTPKPIPGPKPTQSYTIRSGDTLSAIGSRYHVAWTKIYATNKATIEAAAKAHGKSSSGSGHWIYPGTTLVIPG